MITIVNDNEQCVSLIGMTAAQFLSLGEVLKQARRSPNAYVRELAKGLHLTSRWTMDTFSRTISLHRLSWEEIMVLAAFIISWRAIEHEGDVLDELLEALDAAVESVTTTEREESKGRIRR